MPLVPAICPTCGGAIKVDENQKAAICTSCGNPFIVQEAINIHQTKIEHVDVVNVMDDRSAQARLDAAEAQLKLKDFISAQTAFEDACKLRPQDYRGWWGQFRAKTLDLRGVATDPHAVKKLKKLYDNALAVASDQDKQALEQQYGEYWTSMVEPKLAAIKDGLEETGNMEKRIYQLNQECKPYELNITKWRKKYDKWKRLEVVNSLTVLLTVLAVAGALYYVIWLSGSDLFTTVVASIIAVPLVYFVSMFLILSPITAIIKKIATSSRGRKLRKNEKKNSSLQDKIDQLRRAIDAKRDELIGAYDSFEDWDERKKTAREQLADVKAALESMRP